MSTSSTSAPGRAARTSSNPPIPANPPTDDTHPPRSNRNSPNPGFGPHGPGPEFFIDENLFGHATEPFPAHDADADELPYEEPPDDNDDADAAHLLLPPPDFRPFFTLIEDRGTGEHHHPTVHYIFADDDAELVTAAALESIERTAGKPAEARERCVLVDVAPDGRTVAGVSSLSPDWQGLTTAVTQAPSWGDDGAAAEQRGVMLRIAGQQGNPRTATAGAKEKRRGAGEVEDLIKAFDVRLGELDGVLGMPDRSTVQ